MKWILSKPLHDQQAIQEFENKHNITFPESYVETVKNYNNGRPRPNVFDTEQTKERIAKSLLSFDKEHQENIWRTYEITAKQLPADVYPIMIDQFGNFICFYFDPLQDGPTVVFFELEGQNIEKVADSFEQFLDRFYEL